jgi:hypothetical protein
MIAVKSLRPGFENILKYKIKHEIAIVRRMKGGITYFLPKYY